MSGYRDSRGVSYSIEAKGIRRVSPRPVDIKRKERKLRREAKEAGVIEL